MLSDKHYRFIEAYQGDEVQAMQLAGFVGAPNYLKQKARELLANPVIQKGIEERSKFRKQTDKIIADRDEIQAVWTAIFRNSDPHLKPEMDPVTNAPKPMAANIPLSTRLKASENLAKTHGMFIEKVEMKVEHTLDDIIKQSYQKNIEEDLSLEAIEAEYYKHKEGGTVPAFEVAELPDVSTDIGDLI